MHDTNSRTNEEQERKKESKSERKEERKQGSKKERKKGRQEKRKKGRKEDRSKEESKEGRKERKGMKEGRRVDALARPRESPGLRFKVSHSAVHFPFMLCVKSPLLAGASRLHGLKVQRFTLSVHFFHFFAPKSRCYSLEPPDSIGLRFMFPT